jgi:methylated-DNA-[protein]-cysteine S-methyltransferase
MISGMISGGAMIYSYVDSPVGQLLLAGSAGVLKLISFSSGGKTRSAEVDWVRDDAAFSEIKRQLEEYFGGRRRHFDLPMAADATPFQARVLEALRAIPYGETRSYRDIAVAVGNPKAVRAVGGANGNNPLPIVIPCHRVIGSSGALTGFGGGMEAKRLLLDLEARYSGR